ncbi:MAG TPA: SPFH domain-containing protein [Treponemataceae bacterium]|jgi:regulator of protease activity HflC (stomatin/prohibitin superfamily)|nr:MAG: SPFH domain / Band 7 family protein [Spirochaetes bacterium ADurb.Bin269]TAH55423.1 MAG: SPFH domain-containing protein [Treponema sp.]HOC29927.1 SPFH domain-containing protein [Treponemataceae bacterium]HQL32736.1 SPFH domain-containing protein [Treponemataceae bacterium]
MAQEIIEFEKEAKSSNGMFALLANTVLMLASVAALVYGIFLAKEGAAVSIGITLIVASSTYLCVLGPILYCGLKVLKPNEALVLTFFGTYYGTLKGPGFFFVNPFVTAVAPASTHPSTGSTGGAEKSQNITVGNISIPASSVGASAPKKISLKALTLNNDRQKINDALGNPIIIGIVVVWKVVNSAKAVFNVDNYTEFLSIQCDSALRNIVRLYPYDASDDADNEKSLRGSSQEIADSLKVEIQKKVELAGLEIVEARITHLSYAPEIAQAMLQKQQASAVVAARQLIVEGAVGMVEMALAKLSANNIVDLDEERKAAMVSNLLVVLCGNKEAQPIVNSGSIY